jgi:hypothetical protein
MDLQCSLLMGGFAIITMAMGYGYKIHADRRHIKLEKQDKEQHKHNETRIKELEKKNGAEQRQINSQKEEITQLKDNLSKKDQKYKELKGDIRLIKVMMTLSEEARQKKAQELQKQETDEEDEESDNE